MTGSGEVKIKLVWAMLEACADGYRATETKHHYCVRWNEKTYPTFPKGAHGQSNPGIEIGQVRKLARHLEISDCAKLEIPALG